MIAVDTSVVVRYLTDDPTELAHRARALLDDSDAVGVPVVVLLETGHVLRTQYGVSRADVLEVLIELVTRANVELLGLPKEVALGALARARQLPDAPFADALIAATAREAGAASLASFDRGMRRHGIDIVEP